MSSQAIDRFSSIKYIRHNENFDIKLLRTIICLMEFNIGAQFLHHYIKRISANVGKMQTGVLVFVLLFDAKKLAFWTVKMWLWYSTCSVGSIVLTCQSTLPFSVPPTVFFCCTVSNKVATITIRRMTSTVLVELYLVFLRIQLLPCEACQWPRSAAAILIRAAAVIDTFF